jgi:hypothetical protein
MNHSKVAFTASCFLLAAVGCSESHQNEEDTGIILPDSGPVDGGQDAGPNPPGSIGAECSSEVDCTGEGAICLSDAQLLPNGYCTQDCLGGGECPAGSTCLQLSRTEAYCFDECNPDAESRECRSGYGCSRPGPSLPASVCIGGCTDDSDCGSGLRCDPAGSVAGACYSPDASFGDACMQDETCPMGGFCYAEGFGGWPMGACIGFGCDLAANAGCTGDAQCLPSPFGGDGMCVDGCTSDADCRMSDGYACRPSASHPERMACQPACMRDSQCAGDSVCNPALGTCDDPFESNQLGAMCSRREGGCTGGSCLTESGTGFPGAYCGYVGCTLGDDSSCPPGGACAPGAGGLNICLRGCTTATDCSRAGYHCDAIDPTGATTNSLACVPACQADAECVNDGFVCNLGTGLCTTEFVPSNLGAACTGTAECPGGRCLTQWPDGTCAYPGCRLSGEGPSAACPTGSVCIDDERGEPEIGHCLDACTVGASDCRTGYECAAVPGAADTAGYCRPMRV